MDNTVVRLLSASSVSNLSYLQSEAQSCHLLFVSGTGEGSADLTEVGRRFTESQLQTGFMLKPGITHTNLHLHSPLISSPCMLEEMNLAVSKYFHGCCEETCVHGCVVRLIVKNSESKVTSQVAAGFPFWPWVKFSETLPQEEMMSRLTAGDIAATNLFQIFFFFPLTVCADDGGKPCFTEKRRESF